MPFICNCKKLLYSALEHKVDTDTQTHTDPRSAHLGLLSEPKKIGLKFLKKGNSVQSIVRTLDNEEYKMVGAHIADHTEGNQ